MTANPDTEPAPIASEHLLADADLVSADMHWSTLGQGTSFRDGGVAIGRPLLYPITDEELPDRIRKRSLAAGHRYVGMLVAFDLKPPPADQAFAEATFTVRLSDDRLVAIGLVEEDAPGAVAATRSRSYLLDRILGPAIPSASSWGRHSSRFGWTYTGTRASGLKRYNYAMNALLEVPAETSEVSGTLHASVRINRAIGSFSLTHRSAMRDELPFTEPIDPWLVASSPAGASTRLCLALDMERYTRHHNEAAKRAQRRFRQAVEHALGHAQVARGHAQVQEQGDGMLVIFPEVDESRVIPGLVDGLQRGLATVNTDLGNNSRVRVRCALARGLVERADCGYVGTSVTYVSRVIDSRLIRDALTDHPRSDYVFAVSDVLYQDVVSQGYGDLDADMFWKVTAELPSKNFSQPAWLYVPRR